MAEEKTKEQLEEKQSEGGGRGHGRETHRQTETDWSDTGQCETDIADENDLTRQTRWNGRENEE